MAKKLTIKEKREQEKAAKKAAYQQKNLIITSEQIMEEKKVNQKDDPKKDAAPKAKKKSAAKANGLKSVLILENKVQMISYGKGSKAILEKEVEGDTIVNLNNEPVFDADVAERQYEIKRVGVHLEKAGHIDKDIQPKKDIIGAKSALEERYFGKAMDGNIHIQVIYNILDMEKILATHIDNILYSLSNVLRIGEKAEDFVGNLGGKTFEKFVEGKYYGQFTEICKNPRLRYFGGAFFDVGTNKKAEKIVKDINGDMVESAKQRSEEDIYYILSLLGSIRQFTKHGKKDGKGRTWLYSLDRTLLPEEKKLLDKLYNKHISNLNKKFLDVSGKDITLLFRLFEANDLESKQQLAERYYRYIVCKESRNIGFNIKSLREKMLDSYKPGLKDHKYDTVRSKMYKLFDFVILYYFQSEKGLYDADEFVNKLRSCFDDKEKEAAYDEMAPKMWKILSDKINLVVNYVGTGAEIRSIKKDSDISALSLESIFITSDNTSYFSKLMYLMTLFLDGKEINDLLTTQINKLDDIQSFEDIMTQNNMTLFKTAKKDEYDYTFFENASTVADELRVVKSISRMEKPLPSAKVFMYREAYELLGIDEFDDSILGGNVHKVRNFIANSILESQRFQYLIRYANVKKAREFAKCKPLVEYILNKVPESQIDRYWVACGQNMNITDNKIRVKGLAEVIGNLDTSFLNNKTLADDKKRQMYVSIVGLYITVIYQVVKGLVSVNSKYTMAIHSLERDTELIFKTSIFSDRTKCNYTELFSMTDRYIANQAAYNENRQRENEKSKSEGKRHGKKINRHGLECIVKSRNSVANETAHYHIVRMYRNAIAHLACVNNADLYIDVVSKKAKVTSYFELYHLFMQKYLIDSPEFKNEDFGIENSKISEWAKNVQIYNSYSKDFVWALNAPFAYNPPRYKSLSMEDLFYINKDMVVKE